MSERKTKHGGFPNSHPASFDPGPHTGAPTSGPVSGEGRSSGEKRPLNPEDMSRTEVRDYLMALAVRAVHGETLTEEDHQVLMLAAYYMEQPGVVETRRTKHTQSRSRAP